MTGNVLILGANGRFGRNAAEAFWNAGWVVKQHHRKTGDLMEDARGMDVIVHAWNPTYDNWAKEVPIQTRQVINAAKASGATVLIPGNLYVFGARAPEAFGPATAHGATNVLGKVRIEMERSFRDAGVKTIVLRSGDFLDTEASGNWFDKILAKNLRKAFVYPGRPDVPHSWAYLPDVAKAAVELAEQRNHLPTFADIPFPGYTLTGTELAQAVSKVVGRNVKVKPFAWLPIVLLSPFWKMARHLVEMRYLWSKPHHIDPKAFEKALPLFKATPLEEALVHALPKDPIKDVHKAPVLA